MSSWNRLFLLFLLVVAILPVMLLLKLRGHATRQIARALSDSRAWALRLLQALTVSQEEPSRTPMSEMPNPPRDENDRWRVLLDESKEAIKQYLFPRIDMDLASFVRCITFRVFLVVFLDVDPNTLAPPHIQLVTAALSDFYDDNHGKSTLPPKVQSILYGWLPREQFPSSLDRILPAYEALWRIIATLLVTCEDDETKTLRWVMLDFRDNPRDRQFKASLGVDGKSVSAITNDAFGRITPIARPPHAAASTWPLSCIYYTSANSSTTTHRPTVHEALKFAALLASMVIGWIGLHYKISGNSVTGSYSPPWDQRKIVEINRSSDHPDNNVEHRPRPSRQEL